MNTYFKLRSTERFTRFVIGFGIIVSILFLPFTSNEIFMACVLAVYPLVTSLVALDPIFYVVEKVSLNPLVVSEDREMELVL
ncbi:MAG: hypothetical protein OEX07_15405 [Gammaproteobacteria bacterium]|nr:hypothetical protein [Gammaproteobacteria bacterium]